MIETWLIYLRDIKGYSDNTVKAYEKDVKTFVAFVKSEATGKRWSTITRDDIDKYIVWRKNSGCKPATTNRELSSIASLYNFFIRQGWLNENPCKYESRRKIVESIPNTIPVEDIRNAYNHAVGVTKLMIGLLATTGIRLQEMLNLTWSDINFVTNEIKIHGKGQKERLVYSTTEILAPLKNITEYRKTQGYIFHIEQREARFMIYEALKPWSTAPQLSPHAIRHTLATMLASQGANVTALAKILGHKRIDTTQKYIDMTQQGIRQTMQQYNIFN